MINENKQEENLNELKNDVSNKEKNSNDDNGSLQFEESENSSELDEEKEEKQIENKEQNKNQKSNGFNKYKYVKKKTIGKKYFLFLPLFVIQKTKILKKKMHIILIQITMK